MHTEYRGLNTDEKEGGWVSVAPGLTDPIIPAAPRPSKEEEEKLHVVRFYMRTFKPAGPAGPALPPVLVPATAGGVGNEGKEREGKSASGIPGWELVQDADYTAKLEMLVPPAGMGDGGPFEVLVEHKGADGDWPNEILEKNWRDFVKNDLIDAADTVGKWYKSTVVR
jgi:hypothetical protein